MNSMQISAKDQLTSELTKDVVRRAMEAGVNVSNIISQLQDALVDQGHESNTPEDLMDKYRKVFRAMRYIIQPYEVHVEIGFIGNRFDSWEDDLIPLKLTRFGIVMFGQKNCYLSDVAVNLLYEPKKILYNLISEITKAAEENKHKAKTFEAALRSVKAMSDEMHFRSPEANFDCLTVDFQEKTIALYNGWQIRSYSYWSTKNENTLIASGFSNNVDLSRSGL
jgi:hypothetical protein